MIICNSTNVTFQASRDGLIVFTKNCQITSGALQSGSDGPATGDTYNASGALYYIVAVLITYSVAVVGVFAMGFIKRQKQYNERCDKEAQLYIENIDNVRLMSEKKFRVGAVSALLDQVHANSKETGTMLKGASFLNNFALVTMSMTDNAEKRTGGQHDKVVLETVTEESITELDETVKRHADKVTVKRQVYARNSLVLDKDTELDGTVELYGDRATVKQLDACHSLELNNHSVRESTADIRIDVPSVFNVNDSLVPSNFPTSESNEENTDENLLSDAEFYSTDNEMFLSDGTDEFYDVSDDFECGRSFMRKEA